MGTPNIEILEQKLREDVVSYITNLHIPEREGERLRARVEGLEEGRRQDFLQRLAEAVEDRVKVLEHSAIDRNLLKKRLELFLEPQEKGEVQSGAPKEEKEAFTERLQREWEEHPVRTTITGAVVVLGALSVASWIANRFKKATEAGQQAMKTSGSWLKRIAIATGVSLGVFLGLKVYKEYKTVKPYLDALKWRPHSTPEPPKPPEPPRPDVPPVPDGLPEADEVLEQGKNEVMSTGLLTMNARESEQANIRSEAEREIVRTLLYDPEVLCIPLRTLLTVHSKEEARALLTRILSTELSDAQCKALYFIALVCKREQSQVREMLAAEQNPPPFQELHLGDFLLRVEPGAMLFSKVRRGLDGKRWEAFDLDRFQASLFSEEALKEIVDNPTMQERLFATLPIEENRQRDFIAHCLLRGRSQLLKDVQTTTKPQDISAALVHIREVLTSDEALNYLSRYTHERASDFAPVLREHLKTNLTVLDAVQIYAYLQLAKGKSEALPASLRESNAVGALFLQMKTLDLVGKADHDKGVAMSSYLMLEAVKQGKNLDMPPEAVALLRRIAGLAGKTFADFGLHVAQQQANDWWIRFKEFQRSNPYGLAWTADVAAGYTLWEIWERTLLRRRERVHLGKILGPHFQASADPNWVQFIKKNLPIYGPIYRRRLRQGMRAYAENIQNAGMGRTPAMSNPGRVHAAGEAGAESARVESSLGELSRDRQLLKYLGKADQIVEDTEALMQLAEEAGKIKLDPKTLALIRQSPKAKRIIAGAIETADVDEVARALTAAKNAAKLRVGLNAVGAVGDIFGLYMAYADWQANGKRIAETNNPVLKELYADANIVYGAEGTASATGLAIGGYCIVSSFMAGEGTLAALGAAGGTVMLPIAVAVGAGGYSYRKLEGVTETWLKDEKDWAKETPGALRAKMKEMGPGKQGYWQQAARGTRAEVWFRKIFTGSDYRKWEEEHFERIEDANEQTRYLMTRAYMAKMTMLPQNPGESAHDYEERYARYQADQLRYIIKMSDGSMDVMTELYYQAHLHADLMELSRDLQEKNESRIITIPRYDEGGNLIEKQFDLKDYQNLTSKYGITLLNEDGICALYVIHTYEKQKRGGVLLQFNIMKELTKSQPDSRHMIDKSLQHSLLTEARHDLALFERKSLETDYKGWGWTGGEEGSRSLANSVLSNKLRLLLREYSDKFQAKEGGPTLEEYEEAIARLRSFLQTDPLVFFKEGMSRRYTASREARREHSSVYVNLGLLMDSLYVHPPSNKGRGS